jgi:hypothetical protein
MNSVHAYTLLHRCVHDGTCLQSVRSWYITTHRYTIRVGQNRIYALYMTVYLVISLPKISLWFWPTLYMISTQHTYTYTEHRIEHAFMVHCQIEARHKYERLTPSFPVINALIP